MDELEESLKENVLVASVLVFLLWLLLLSGLGVEGGGGSGHLLWGLLGGWLLSGLLFLRLGLGFSFDLWLLRVLMLLGLWLLSVLFFRNLGLLLLRRFFFFWLLGLLFSWSGLFFIGILLLLGSLFLEVLGSTGLSRLLLLIWLGSFGLSSLLSRGLLLVLRLICSGLGRCLWCNGWLWLHLDRGLEELVQDLVDLTIEDFTCNKWILVPSVLLVLLWHDSDVVDKNFELIVIEVFDELVVVVLELLKAVIVIEKLVN